MIVTKADDSFKSGRAPWYQSQGWQINFELLKAEYRLTFVAKNFCLHSSQLFVYNVALCEMSYEINLLVVKNQMTLILADFQVANLCQINIQILF